MGVFDHIKCLLPLPDWDGDPDTEFQTKDTPYQFMSNYMIGRDGKLYEEVQEWETVPPEEREFPPDHKFHNIVGVMRVKKSWIEEVEDFHGDIRFYNYVNGDFVEFVARFTDGVCTRIKRVYSTTSGRLAAGSQGEGVGSEGSKESQAAERPGENEGEG